MKHCITTPLIVSSLCLAGFAVAAGHGPDWSYDGDNGPENWGSLHPEFATCDTGRNQSPVDLSRMVDSELAPIEFDYQAAGYEIINNGHTVQVNYAPGSSITLDGRQFELRQFHFHAPSENTIERKSFPMEGHLVHADANGNLAVIGIMFQEAKEHRELAKAWAQLPKVGTSQILVNTVDAEKLLPQSRDYYRFSGSLTTPPCSEGVRWLVMKQPVSVSGTQIDAFFNLMGHANNRPVQPLNGRVISQ